MVLIELKGLTRLGHRLQRLCLFCPFWYTQSLPGGLVHSSSVSIWKNSLVNQCFHVNFSLYLHILVVVVAHLYIEGQFFMSFKWNSVEYQQSQPFWHGVVWWWGEDGFWMIQAHYIKALFLLCGLVSGSSGLVLVCGPEVGDPRNNSKLTLCSKFLGRF